MNFMKRIRSVVMESILMNFLCVSDDILLVFVKLNSNIYDCLLFLLMKIWESL